MKEIGIIGYGWLGERIASVLSGKHKLSVTTTTEDKLRILHSKGIHAVVASFRIISCLNLFPGGKKLKIWMF
ncbi:hypothetical protein OWR28_13750 [Chryseobacterium sp. 1B4]